MQKKLTKDKQKSKIFDKSVFPNAKAEILTKEQHHVLREKGTELAFSGKLIYNKEKGVYSCVGCGNKIFSSDTKFDSDCGWPSFYEAKKGAIELKKDSSLSMIRTEVVCKKCGGHLGHVFNDAPQTPTGKRYCINSVVLKFKDSEKIQASSSKKRERKKK